MCAVAWTATLTLYATVGKNLAISRRQIRRDVRRASTHEFQNARCIVTRRPDFAQKISRVNSVLAQEAAVAATAVHQFRGHFPTQLGVCLRDDTWQPFNT